MLEPEAACDYSLRPSQTNKFIFNQSHTYQYKTNQQLEYIYVIKS